MRYYEVHDEEATLLTEDGKMLVSVFSSEQDLGGRWEEGFDYTFYLIQEDGTLSELDGGFYTGYWHLSKFVDDVCSGLEHTRVISQIAGAVDTMEDLAALLHEDGLPEGVGTDDVKGFIMSMRDRFTAGPLHGDQLVFDCSARALMAAGFTADMLEGRPDRAIITPEMAHALLSHEESWGDYCKGTFLLQKEGKYVCIDNFNGLALKESFKTLAAANLWLESGDLEQAMDIDRPSPRAAEPEGIDAIAQAAGEASACLANETESLDGRVERAMGELLPGKISELKEEAAAELEQGNYFKAGLKSIAAENLRLYAANELGAEFAEPLRGSLDALDAREIADLIAEAAIDHAQADLDYFDDDFGERARQSVCDRVDLEVARHGKQTDERDVDTLTSEMIEAVRSLGDGDISDGESRGKDSAR